MLFLPFDVYTTDFFPFTPLSFLFKFPEFSEEQSIEKKYPGVLSAILVDFMKVINGSPAGMIHCPTLVYCWPTSKTMVQNRTSIGLVARDNYHPICCNLHFQTHLKSFFLNRNFDHIYVE